MAEACGDDRWKLSTSKGRSKSGRSCYSSSTFSDGNAAGSSSAASLSRSYSASVSCSRNTSSTTAGCSSSSSQQPQQPQQSNSRLSKKCVEAVKEHRARFYIVRRCVSMLVCWRDH
ncbi:hypothetical protein ABZP36_017388 [Zizania latifolia]